MTSVPVPSPGDVVRIRAARWRVSRATRHDTTAVVEVLGLDRGSAGVRARFVLPFERIDPIGPPASPRLQRPAAWARSVRGVLAGATRRADSLRALAGARIDLLPFQLEPALAVVRGEAARLLIADAVGLGKTIQAGLVVAEAIARLPDPLALVVSPAGLRAQWRAELSERFAVESALVDAAAMSAHAWSHANPWTLQPVSIVSIDFVKRPEVLRSLEPLVWDVVVFDEAHALAGRSDRAAAARAIAERARTVILLSATPHSGDDDAFARLTSLGDLKDRFPLVVFQRTRASLGIAAGRRTRWLRIRPTPAERAMHDALLTYAARVWRERRPGAQAARLAMGVLLRRACSSARSLARSLERRRTALAAGPALAGGQLPLPLFDDPADDQEPDAVLGAPGLLDADAEQGAITRVLELALTAAARESKLAALARLIRRTREPVIAFTEYRDTLLHAAAVLAQHAPVLLHGGLSAAERLAALASFTRGHASLLLATDAASEGLNLQQRCRTVVNLELPWTPVRLEQRIGRVDRIGQRRTVHAVQLVAAGTGEESTVARLHDRLARAAATLHGVSPEAPRDADVADAVVRGVVPRAAAREPVWRGAVAGDLRAAAVREIADALVLRGLGPATVTDTGAVTEPRAVLTRIRRRGARPAIAGRYWAVHAPFSTADGEVIWSALLCLYALPVPDDGARNHVRDLLGMHHVEALARAAQARMLDELRPAIDRWRALAEHRELAIAGALTARSARMAATLIQSGLFDRRAERLAAAQAALLEAAARRTEARLARVRQCIPCAEPIALAFAALVG
jgi:superfamily II DNA or RNA helicase